jgi:hypothetical protein
LLIALKQRLNETSEIENRRNLNMVTEAISKAVKGDNGIMLLLNMIGR